jgi:putative FmdB family regulatory protein
MPVYEYQCQGCGRDFEYQQRMSDPDKTTCEVCGGALDRLISRTAFSLKGSGWYKDLYASPKPAGSDAKAETRSDGGTDAKSDAPAAKADAPAAADKPASDKPAAKPSPSGGSGSTGGGASGGSTGSSTGSSSGSVAKAS